MTEVVFFGGPHDGAMLALRDPLPPTWDWASSTHLDPAILTADVIDETHFVFRRVVYQRVPGTRRYNFLRHIVT